MNLKINYSILYILLQLFVFQVSIAQEKTSVSGIVTDLKGYPISRVSVLLKETNFRTESDDQGQFMIFAPEGRYIMLISRVGYKQYSQEIILSESRKLTLKPIQLSTASELEQVEVKGKTMNTHIKEQAFHVNVIDAKQFYSSSADLNQVLGKTSGVTIREDGGMGSDFTFSLNGFSGKQVKFFLDGIPMDNFGSSLSLNNLPVNMAERIEIYKGVLPVHLGADALGGAVNIISRSNLNFTDVSYGYGSFNSHKSSINHAYSDAKTGITFRANGFYNYSDNNYKVNLNPIINNIRSDIEQEFERFHDGYESIGILTEIGVSEKSYADKLAIGLIASGNEKDIQTGVTMDVVYGAKTSKSTSLIPTLKYKKTDLFIDGLDLSFYGAFNMTKNRFIDTARVKYDWFGKMTRPAGATAEANRTQLINRDHEALTTANIAYHFANHQALSVNYMMTNYRRKSSDVEDPDNITYNYPQKLNKEVLGLAWQQNYAQFTSTLFSKLYLQHAESFEQVANGTGVPDYEKSDVHTGDFGYGAAAAYFVLPQVQVKASYEHTYRLPEAIELLGDGLYVRRNTALKAENSNNFNLGARYALHVGDEHRLGIEANYILRKAHDYIRLDQRQSQPIDRQYINIGDVQTNGIEGEISYSRRSNFNLSMNLTYQNIIDNEKFYTSTNLTGTNTFPNLGYGHRIANMPYLFGHADIGYAFEKIGTGKNRLSLNYTLDFVQKYYFTPHHLGSNNGDVIPTQISHQIMVGYVLKGGKYSVSAECENLTNNRLYDNFRMQKPGRSFFLKLRYFIANN